MFHLITDQDIEDIILLAVQLDIDLDQASHVFFDRIGLSQVERDVQARQQKLNERLIKLWLNMQGFDNAFGLIQAINNLRELRECSKNDSPR